MLSLSKRTLTNEKLLKIIEESVKKVLYQQNNPTTRQKINNYILKEISSLLITGEIFDDVRDYNFIIDAYFRHEFFAQFKSRY